MKKIGLAAAMVLAVILLGSTTALGEDAKAGSSTRPPTNLKKVGDHWTPWDPPAPGPESYIIQKDDTLWDLAQKWLGNPRLWPQIWDLNRYILDSHWIYPGDPLGVPGKPTVVPPEGPPKAEQEAAEPEEGTGAEVTEAAGEESPARTGPAEAPLLPVADATDVYCSGYIESPRKPLAMRLKGAELEKIEMATGDVVYVNQGAKQGLEPGARYSVIRTIGPVTHPKSHKKLGVYVKRLGTIRLMAVQEAVSTAVVESACENMVPGDELVPWDEISIPRRRGMPPFDAKQIEASGGATGWIVAFRDQLTAVGSGYVAYADLGGDSGVKPGDVLSIYREGPGRPRAMLGQAVVFEIKEKTCAVKVAHAEREIVVGDRVEVLQP